MYVLAFGRKKENIFEEGAPSKNCGQSGKKIKKIFSLDPKFLILK